MLLMSKQLNGTELDLKWRKGKRKKRENICSQTYGVGLHLSAFDLLWLCLLT